ncbi:hypothetical protein RIVM261_076770 [Rivularia sp. IAM M-261]|nr:hypothetical protein RIVM261_076770 [Rivularia sp. IAM M-261]
MKVITIRETQATATGFVGSLIFDDGEYQINITDPFTPSQERQLEWYFEEWLTYPMLNGVKAQKAKASVISYGESLFNQVFGDRGAYSRYCQLRGELAQVKIEIVGNSPEFHALHWEAMRDKDLPRPLAVDCVMVRKRIQKPAPVPANLAESPVINLLVVISRPNEEHDVGYRTIARPLIEVLQNSKLPVNVDLLRPGTYESLERHLEEKGAGYYHIIHFDCHGSLMAYADIETGVERDKYTYQARWGREDIQPYEGVKAFLFLDGESKGKADPVEAGELADLLTGKRIPVCILNACQSGKQIKGDGDREETEENSRETSLGSRLMAAGMQMVVAMGYSVTVSAAKLMMKQIYRNLFARQEITEAIRLARRELYNDKTRKAYFNTNIDLEDWLLPVVYSNQKVNLNLRDFTQQEEKEYFERLGNLYQYEAPQYGFIGRDLEILKIEKLLFRHNILLLQGMGGTGKTTLLDYLRSWWQTTDFATDIFYFGYDERAWTLTQILFEIGKLVYNKFEFANFQAMNLTGQTQKLITKLRSEAYILMLDNLESVTGQALAIQNTLSLSEQKQLQNFLTRLVEGKTRVILGSRSSESWLQGAFKQNIYKLQGLDVESRTELSNKILEQNVWDKDKITKIREDEDFQKLMKLLAGYPLAMKVVLTNLKKLAPQKILEKIQAADINLDTESEDKTQSIIKCVEYSHSNLSPDAQKLLLCLAPFSGFIVRDAIPLYVGELQKLEAFQDYDFDKFDAAIQEAINWGLLSDLSPNFSSKKRGEEQLLQIQPIFPFFLKVKVAELKPVTREALQESFKNYCISLTNYYSNWIQSKQAKEQQLGIFFCKLEYENLYNALKICLDKQETVSIFFCLYNYLNIINDISSLIKLSEFVYNAQAAYAPEIKIGQIGCEIVMVLDRLANGYLLAQNYPKAEELYQRSIKLLQQLQDVEPTQIKSGLASTYYGLGRVAQELREYQQAHDYYQQALDIFIEHNAYFTCAYIYHQLGNVAQELREYHQAQNYYQQALQIFIQSGAEYEFAGTYHQLGIVAQELQEYHQAQDYYQKALKIKIEFRARFECASTYHQLGIVAEKLREYHQAQDYHQKALEIYIEFSARFECARTYYQLGVVVQELREYHQARDYYQQALQVYIELDDRYRCAEIYCQLGTVAEEFQENQQARNYYQQALQIYIEFGDKYGCASIYQNLGIVALRLRDNQQAHDYYQQALKIYTEFGATFDSANAYHLLGVVAQELQEFKLARNYYQQALKIYIEFGARYKCAATYFQLAKLAEELGDLEEAKNNYLQDLVISAEFNDEHGLGVSLRNLARFYQVSQDEDLLVEVAKLFKVTVAELKKAIMDTGE